MIEMLRDPITSDPSRRWIDSGSITITDKNSVILFVTPIKSDQQQCRSYTLLTAEADRCALAQPLESVSFCKLSQTYGLKALTVY